MPNLTINMGLHWSYFGSYYAKQNNLDVLRLGSGLNPLAGMNIRVGGSLYQSSKVNLGPQIGFACQPKQLEGKMVFRGGFGVNYNQNEIAITANGFGNPPNAVRAAYTYGYPYTSNPNCKGTGIIYQTANNIDSIFGYSPNPNATTAFGSDNLPLSGESFLAGFPQNPSTVTNYHYSFGFEYQLPHHLVVSLGYQGSASHHLITQYNYKILALYKEDALIPRVNFPDYSQAPMPGIERNISNAPGYTDLDGSLSKAFALPNMKLTGDTEKIDIRADAHNFLNKVNTNPSSIQNVIGTVNPSGQVNDLQSNVGTATSALGSRTVQP